MADHLERAAELIVEVEGSDPLQPQNPMAASLVLAHAFIDIAGSLRSILAELKANGEGATP